MKAKKKKRKKPKSRFKDIKRIRIRTVDPDVLTQKGLFDEGCYGSKCDDVCCQYGCDVDYASYKLILRYRDLIEPLVKADVEDCFATGLKADDDYIGGAYRETAVREKDERCALHLRGRKGCSLFYLWATRDNIPKRLVPTICRTYPVTWHRGHLFVDRPLRRACKCMEPVHGGRRVPSVYETQKKEVRALFDIDKKELEKLARLEKKLKAGKK